MRYSALRLHEVLTGLGAPTAAGLLALALAAGAAAVLLPADHAALDAARAAHAAALRAPESPAARVADAGADLQTFYAGLPPQDSATQWLNRVFAAAARAGLALERGEYRLVADVRGPLVRYEVELPVRGEYLQLRRFLREALTEVPHLAVDALSLQRPHIGTGVIDARLRLTFYLHGRTA
jgi:hypothetical protein